MTGRRRYRVVVTDRAERQLAAISEPYRTKLAGAINGLAENPRPRGCKKLVGDVLFRVRVGDYRVIYAIDDAVVTVTVTKTAHRSRAY